MKTGIFICHCGHNIKHTVDVRKVRAYFSTFPHVAVSSDYPFVCSEPGQDMIRESIEKEGLDRVVIASCTPSLHQELFKDLLKKARPQPLSSQEGGHQGALLLGRRRCGEEHGKGNKADQRRVSTRRPTMCPSKKSGWT